jgi:hypothetical protein
MSDTEKLLNFLGCYSLITFLDKQESNNYCLGEQEMGIYCLGEQGKIFIFR